MKKILLFFGFKSLPSLIIQAVIWIIFTIIGVWYLYSSMGNASIPYMSLPRFLTAIGACDANGVCDISSANGCFLCPYIEKLFTAIGDATTMLWDAIVGHTWILMAIGMGLVMMYKAYEIIKAGLKQSAENIQNPKEITFEYSTWWEAVKKQLVKVIVVGGLLGIVSGMGNKSLEAISGSVVYPVMAIGTNIAMMVNNSDANMQCNPKPSEKITPMTPVYQSFLCVIGNLNSIVLYAAHTGFSMMGMAWMGLAGGIFGWLAGLVVVIMFMNIGFHILFKVMNVVFSLVMVIVCLPLIIAAWAFQENWSLAQGVVSGSIKLLAKTAVRVIGITLEILMIYTIIMGAMDMTLHSNPKVETEILQKCENASINPDGKTFNVDTYRACFLDERKTHTDAFLYMDKGIEFLWTMILLFLVYKVFIEARLQTIFDLKDKDGGDIKFGDSVKGFWTAANNLLKHGLAKIPFKKGAGSAVKK